MHTVKRGRRSTRQGRSGGQRDERRPRGQSSDLSDAEGAPVWQKANRISCTPLPSSCLTDDAMTDGQVKRRSRRKERRSEGKQAQGGGL